MSMTAIGDHALLSDRHSAALVTRDGSIDWLCFPRFDSPSVFARLLGDDAGHWSIRAAGYTGATRRYLDHTMVLETIFHTPTGVCQLEDALALGRGNRDHDLGVGAPHLLIRRATCLSGAVERRSRLLPPARVRPRLTHSCPHRRRGSGHGRCLPFWCSSTPAPLDSRARLRRGSVLLREGARRLPSRLQHCARTEPGSARVWAQQELSRASRRHVAAWQSWSAHHRPTTDRGGIWSTTADACFRRPVLPTERRHRRGRDHVAARGTSGVTGTGTIATAGSATRASPSRRCGWRPVPTRRRVLRVHDASAATSVGRGKDLQIMFGIGGEWDLSERALRHLRGWRDSRPVRVGNGAWNQRQIDVYGELLCRHPPARRPRRATFDDNTRRFLVDVADAAARSLGGEGPWDLGGPRRPASTFSTRS